VDASPVTALHGASILRRGSHEPGLGAPMSAVAAVASPNSASVLVVDDDSDIRAALSEILRDEGFRVRDVANGFDALARLAESEPDVVLVDPLAAEEKGWPVMESLRRLCPRLPIVVLAARPVDGCDDYVPKPLSLHRLQRLIAGLRLQCGPGMRAARS
jgi:CheY-like chemotaxis protein